VKPKPAARSTIIIRELPDSVEEKEIREEFKDFAESIVEVRGPSDAHVLW
jgi:RNA recognition motif-containing protein